MAYAVGPDGHRRLLGLTLGYEESEDSWSDLLAELLERGLSGVQLAIADEHAGLAAAVRKLLPEARRQRCTVHLKRNVGAKAPPRLRKRVAREVAAIFQAPGRAEAKKLLAEFKARRGKELPEALEVLKRGFPAATQFYAFPEAHWPRLRTTNGLERLHGEIKRRIKAAGASPTGPARSGSSPPSRSRRPRSGATDATSTCRSSTRRRWPRRLRRRTEEFRSAFYTQIGSAQGKAVDDLRVRVPRGPESRDAFGRPRLSHRPATAHGPSPTALVARCLYRPTSAIATRTALHSLSVIRSTAEPVGGPARAEGGAPPVPSGTARPGSFDVERVRAYAMARHFERDRGRGGATSARGFDASPCQHARPRLPLSARTHLSSGMALFMLPGASGLSCLEARRTVEAVGGATPAVFAQEVTVLLRSWATFALLLATVACDMSNGLFDDPLLSRAPNAVAGLYELEKVNGDPLPSCCRQGDSGKIFGGVLDLHGGEAGDDAYTWHMSQAQIHSGTTTVHRYLFSAGTYTSDGQNLILTDSTGLGTMAGVINADVITVAADDNEYEFVKWLPNLVGEYIMLGCWEADVDSAGCAQTDSDGAVVTIVDGWLYLGPHEGRDAYDWYTRRRYDYRDGTSNVENSLFSAGSYTLDGETLTLVDSTGAVSPITATVSNSGGLITFVTQGRRYEFGKRSRLPG